jgi:predicted MFS family arabinose efflux permease
MSNLSAARARRRYLVLIALRWLPTGMLVPVLTLLPLERGLSLSELGLAVAVQGFVVLGLELPTGGLSDSLGRKPVLLAAGGLALVAGGLYFVADTFAMFMAAYAVQGVYRALDSGPLEAWYVDAALADDPDADISHGLSRGGAALGLSLAAGALVAGGLVALDPFPSIETLAVPVLASLAAQVVSIAAIVVLLTERRPGQGMRSVGRSVRAVPTVIGQTFGLLRSSKILRALVAVEVFWGFGMVTFEGLTPVRLSEVTSGGADTAAALMGPASSAAWIASAAGSAAAPLLARRLGVPLTAAALRILHGLTVAGMAVFAGPAGVIAAYLASYVIHGASNPLHMTLLHDQVTSAHRSTVISLNSMVAQPAASVGLVVLTALADATSVRLAIVVGAVVITLAAPLYLPARRSRRQPASAAPTADPTVPAS